MIMIKRSPDLGLIITNDSSIYAYRHFRKGLEHCIGCFYRNYRSIENGGVIIEEDRIQRIFTINGIGFGEYLVFADRSSY